MVQEMNKMGDSKSFKTWPALLEILQIVSFFQPTMIQEMNKMGGSGFKAWIKKIPWMKVAFLTTHDPSKFWVRLGLVMGPGQKFLTQVRSAIYGLGLNLENFP